MSVVVVDVVIVGFVVGFDVVCAQARARAFNRQFQGTSPSLSRKRLDAHFLEKFASHHSCKIRNLEERKAVCSLSFDFESDEIFFISSQDSGGDSFKLKASFQFQIFDSLRHD